MKIIKTILSLYIFLLGGGGYFLFITIKNYQSITKNSFDKLLSFNKQDYNDAKVVVFPIKYNQFNYEEEILPEESRQKAKKVFFIKSNLFLGFLSSKNIISKNRITKGIRGNLYPTKFIYIENRALLL